MAKISFKEKVFKVVKGIKKGQVMTYQEVAKKVSHPGAARAVGSILKTNYDPQIPCHRVIRSDGGMGGYNRGGQTKKLAILKKEGVKF
ncbi:MAG: MGMT family protein [Candidatus Pacebacteria bacterium]|nr:MGMT family protein [Candidatus Paceibacterota bacterium]